MDREKRRDRLNRGEVESGLILANYVRGHTVLITQRTLHGEHFARELVKVKIFQLASDIRKVHRLHAQTVLLRGSHLERRNTHQWIARPSCHLLCFVQRDTEHFRRGNTRVQGNR
jgi:hypothetical protein